MLQATQVAAFAAQFVLRQTMRSFAGDFFVQLLHYRVALHNRNECLIDTLCNDLLCIKRYRKRQATENRCTVENADWWKQNPRCQSDRRRGNSALKTKQPGIASEWSCSWLPVVYTTWCITPLGIVCAPIQARSRMRVLVSTDKWCAWSTVQYKLVSALRTLIYNYILNSSRKNAPLVLKPLLHNEKQRAHKIAARYTNRARTARPHKYYATHD